MELMADFGPTRGQTVASNGKPWRPDPEDDEPDAPFIPSPAEIAKGCDRIRASWSPAEKARRRCGGVRVRWEVPRAIGVSEE